MKKTILIIAIVFAGLGMQAQTQTEAFDLSNVQTDKTLTYAESQEALLQRAIKTMGASMTNEDIFGKDYVFKDYTSYKEYSQPVVCTQQAPLILKGKPAKVIVPSIERINYPAKTYYINSNSLGTIRIRESKF